MAGGQVRAGDLVVLGTTFYEGVANGARKRKAAGTPMVQVIGPGVNAVLAPFPVALVAAAGGVVGQYVYVWTVPAGAGDYEVFYYDAAGDPAIPDIWCEPSSENYSVEANADPDALLDRMKKQEDNNAGTWNSATQNFKEIAEDAEAARSSAVLAAADALTAKNRLGADADANPVGAQTKLLSAVALGAPVAGSIGKLVQDINAAVAALPAASAIADAVLDEVLSGHLTLGTVGWALATYVGRGAGNKLVDHNTGGADNLQFRNAATLAGVQDGVVRVFLKADWDGNLRSIDYQKAWWDTDSNGRAINPVQLSAGSYTAVAYRARAGAAGGIKLKTKDFTVT